MWTLKIQQTSAYEEKKQIHRYREQTDDYQWGEGAEKGQCMGRGLRGINC